MFWASGCSILPPLQQPRWRAVLIRRQCVHKFPSHMGQTPASCSGFQLMIAVISVTNQVSADTPPEILRHDPRSLSAGTQIGCCFPAGFMQYLYRGFTHIVAARMIQYDYTMFTGKTQQIYSSPIEGTVSPQGRRCPAEKPFFKVSSGCYS